MMGYEELKTEAIILLRHIMVPLTFGLAAHFSCEPRARLWHRTLRKSTISPPPVVFPLAWLGCYVSLGFATYRAAKSGAGEIEAITYLLHLTMVNAWNPIFFLFRRLEMAAQLLVVIIATTPVLIMQMFSWDNIAGAVLVPYYGWLMLLTHLSFYMDNNNPGPHFGTEDDEAHCKTQ